MGRALGIDLGTVRIGVALSDPGKSTALPHSVIDRLEDDEATAAAVMRLARDLEASVVVVGLPLRMDGSKGPAAIASEEFAARLRALGASVHMQDERLSSAEAGKRMREGGTGSRAARGRVDKVAAALMLQTYLDARG